MDERIVYTCGPYKGYCGKAEFLADDNCFGGQVLGLRDVITFEADDFHQLGQAFCESVDAYLKFCEQQGQRPGS